ncbi:MAG: NAD(P)H-dependent oxidoreductase subunit E [Pseudomonadales bacterium]|nr:NAD(P)H-dependent oxidoreductase subunit E [Pseudomonadales bacterium]
MSENISKLSGRKGLKDNLFERITAFGDKGRIPDKSEMASIASEYNLGKATIYGSSTFYEFLDKEHLQKKAYVCNGTACLCAGTQEKVHQTLAEKLGDENIGHMTCLGRCHENSAFHYQGKNYSGNAINRIKQILAAEATDNLQQDNYSVTCSAQTAVLTADNFTSTESFQDALERVFKASPQHILDEIKTANLRGRGGAGFPTGFKWESCRNAGGDEKYVVCNADEGDPGAYSDRYLMEKQPLRVLFGMLVAGWIVGAKEGVLYIRAEYPQSIHIINDAIRLLEKHNLAGDNILGSDFSFRLKVVKGAGAYICGEETALIASIEGRRAEVDVRPPFPTIEGLYKKPTALNNVETFAAIPALLAMGGKAFATIGNGRSTGTKLVSLDGNFNRPGMVEVDMDTPLAVVINEIGGGFKVPVKALHIGGPLGGLVPVKEINALKISFESFAEAGFLLGHASIVCIPESYPLISYIEHLFDFTKAESCGKCFPCRLGSTRGLEMTRQAITGEHKLDRTLLNDLLDTLQKGSLCALGGGLPLPIRNALQYFDDELKPYFSDDGQIPAVEV